MIQVSKKSCSKETAAPASSSAFCNAVIWAGVWEAAWTHIYRVLAHSELTSQWVQLVGFSPDKAVNLSYHIVYIHSPCLVTGDSRRISVNDALSGYSMPKHTQVLV